MKLLHRQHIGEYYVGLSHVILSITKNGELREKLFLYGLIRGTIEVNNEALISH